MNAEKSAAIIRLNEMLQWAHECDEVKPVFTPFASLGKEIIEKLPTTQGSILVLSDGGLLVALLLNNRAANITFVAHTNRQAEFARQVGVTKIIQVGYNDPIKELEKCLMGMKFDIVVGNPPYQPPQDGGTFSGSKLWPRFIAMAHDLTTDGGIFSLITPQGWLRAAKTNKPYQYVFNNEVLFVRAGIPGSVFGEGVATVVGYFITRKAARSEKFKLQCSDGEMTLLNDGSALIPNIPFTLADFAVISKVTESPNKLPLCYDFVNSKLGFSVERTEEFSVPAYLEANRKVFIKDTHKSQGRKLIVFRILKRAKSRLVFQTRIDEGTAVIADHGIHPYILESSLPAGVTLEKLDEYLQSEDIQKVVNLFAATAHMPLNVLQSLNNCE